MRSIVPESPPGRPVEYKCQCARASTRGSRVRGADGSPEPWGVKMAYRPPKGVRPPQLEGRRGGRPKGSRNLAPAWRDARWGYEHRREDLVNPPRRQPPGRRCSGISPLLPRRAGGLPPDVRPAVRAGKTPPSAKASSGARQDTSPRRSTNRTSPNSAARAEPGPDADPGGPDRPQRPPTPGGRDDASGSSGFGTSRFIGWLALPGHMSESVAQSPANGLCYGTLRQHRVSSQGGAFRCKPKKNTRLEVDHLRPRVLSEQDR
jgi:hypothetical protein